METPKTQTHTIEVESDFSRTCARCKSVIYAEPLGFHKDSRDGKFKVDHAKFPNDWGFLSYLDWGFLSYNVPVVESGFISPVTTHVANLCGTCVKEVLKYIGNETPQVVK